jgi:glutathione S-transferase
LHQHDPDGWLGENDACADAATPLIVENDTAFKDNLDRYKYPERYPEYSQIHYRTQAEIFLQQLEDRLCATPCLLGETMSIADMGVFPFIRQLAGVDKNWFAQSPYASLRRWLKILSNSARFDAVMKKFPPWQPGDLPVIMTNKRVNLC